MRETGVLSRRRFLAVATAATAGNIAIAWPVSAASARRIPGANETIRLGVIGCGARGSTLLRDLLNRSARGEKVRVVAVCDAWEQNALQAKHWSGAEDSRYWKRLLDWPDVDAVVIATPHHWHASMAIAAMQSGKDVYCEQPMARTIAEARAFRDCAAVSRRVVQIGTQQTSEGQWRTAREVVASGKIGRVLWSQGSYEPRPGMEAKEERAGTLTPATLDWDAFLGPAPRRPFDAARVRHWRRYWDYSGGVAADLLYGKLAPLLVAIGSEFPERVSAAGGVYAQDGREVPDTFVMSVEYPSGHTVVLASSMTNDRRLPAVIRGQEATVYCEGDTVCVVAEHEYREAFRRRFGDVKPVVLAAERRPDHMTNWLQCLRNRSRCACDDELGYRTMVAIGMGVQAYKRAATLFFDRDREEIIARAPRTFRAARAAVA